MTPRLYNQDIVEEDAITKWNAAAASNSLFKADIQPLVKWLQYAIVFSLI